MALFRYAKSYKYGLVSGIGMFIGHFFAWGSAGLMGATASIILGKSLNNLDSGAITNVVLGGMGLLAVIVAGWTTANPSIYRASLAFQTVFEKLEIKKLTYIVGLIMTVMASFPITSNVMVIVNIIVLIVPAIGSIVLTEHWLFPKIGYTRYWSKYKGYKINPAALSAWIVSLIFVIVMTKLKIIHSYFLFLPTYILASISYIVIAGILGAKDDYSREEKIENEIQSELLEMVEEESDEQVIDKKVSSKANILTYMSYGILIVIAILTVMVFNKKLDTSIYKTVGMVLTGGYFILGFTSVYIKNYMKAENIEEKELSESL